MESIIGIVVILAIVFAIAIPISLRKNKFKERHISKAIEEVFPGAVYEPTKHLTKKEYKEIGCLRKGTFFEGSDLLNAQTQAGTPFRFSEINTYDHSENTDIEVFKGGIFSFKYPKKFNERVYLCSKKGSGKGAFKSEFFKTEKIETENPEFNETYWLYSEDPQIAFYLCTPQIMEKLIQLKSTQKSAVIISFRDNWMHVAIPKTNLFKTPVFGIKNKEKIEKYIGKTKEDLKRFTDFVDMFDLDSRLFVAGSEEDYSDGIKRDSE